MNIKTESGGSHYCEKDTDAITLKERKEFCNGKYFEQKKEVSIWRHSRR